MNELPSALRSHVDASDPRGRVVGLLVRPQRRAPALSVDAWDVAGPADHGTSRRRAVTLLQAEHLPVIASLLGREAVDPALLRRNVIVRGFNLEIVRGRRFAVGDAILQGTKRCDPCERMEAALGAGGFAAMLGHGGWCAEVLEPGILRVGDEVRLLLEG